MKLQCSYCKDRATLLESEPDVSDLAHAVCNDCCVSGLRCCTTEPLPDLAALRRDAATLERVRKVMQEWVDGPVIYPPIATLCNMLGIGTKNA